MLPGTASALALVTVAVFARSEVVLVGVTTIDTVFDEPLPIDGKSHLTVPETLLQVPPVAAVTDLKVVPAGTGSSMCTPAAASGPLFVTVSVYVRSWLTITGSGASVLVIDRSPVVVTKPNMNVAGLPSSLPASAGSASQPAIAGPFGQLDSPSE